ncbi:UNVERIFIED_CONTAM: hypothetical protein FKN15_025936 [Acipenser sinensis]
MKGAATGGIVGGIIAVIIILAVIGTIVMVIKNRTNEENVEGPPSYRPPPPKKTGGSTEALDKLHVDAPSRINATDVDAYYDDPAEAHFRDNSSGPPGYSSPSGQEENYQRSALVQDDYLEQTNPVTDTWIRLFFLFSN